MILKSVPPEIGDIVPARQFTVAQRQIKVGDKSTAGFWQVYMLDAWICIDLNIKKKNKPYNIL
jgi:hypothetical protein